MNAMHVVNDDGTTCEKVQVDDLPVNVNQFLYVAEFRIGQDEFGSSRWEPVLENCSDLEALGRHKKKLMGPARGCAGMLPALRARMFALLDWSDGDKRKTAELKSEQNRLLGMCPFLGDSEQPPYDFDKNDLKIERLKQTVGIDAAIAITRSIARRMAMAIDQAEAKHGVRITWYQTNVYFGLHGHFKSPVGVDSPWLLLARLQVVKDVVRDANAWLAANGLLDEHLPKIVLGTEEDDLEKRPVLFLDDSLFRKYPTARAGQWRLPHTIKTNPNGSPKVDSVYKVQVDVATMQPVATPVPHAYDNAGRLLAAIELVDQEQRERTRNRSRLYKAMPGAFTQTPLPTDLEVTDDDLTFVRTYPKLSRVWDEEPGKRDGSKRFFELIVHAVGSMGAGFDRARLHRLAYAMPGSKAACDKHGTQREAGYVDDTIGLAIDVIAKGKYGYLHGMCPDDVPDGPDDPPPYVPSSGLAGTNLRAWLSQAVECVKHKPRRSEAEVTPELVSRALVGALLQAGAADELARDVAAQLSPVLTAATTVRGVRERLAEGKPVAGSSYLRRALGALECWKLAKALQQDLPASDAFAKVAIGGGLVSYDRPTSAWLEEVARQLPENHPARKPLLRPGHCCLMHEERRSNFDGRCLSAKKFVCDSPLCASCWGRRVRAEVRLALDGWETEDGERVPGWKQQSTTFDVCWIKGIPDWTAARRVMEETGTHPGPKLRMVGVNPEDGTLEVALFSTSGDAIYTSSALIQSRDRSKDSKQVFWRKQDLTAEQAAAYALELRASWHVWLRRLVDERRGEDLAKAMAAMKGKHLVSRGKAALSWPPRQSLRAALRTSVKLDETDAHDELAGFHHTLRYTKTGTVLHVQEHPHTYDQAVGHLRAAHNAEKVGRDWAGAARARCLDEAEDPAGDVDLRNWLDPPIGPAALLGAAGRAPQ